MTITNASMSDQDLPSGPSLPWFWPPGERRHHRRQFHSNCRRHEIWNHFPDRHDQNQIYEGGIAVAAMSMQTPISVSMPSVTRTFTHPGLRHWDSPADNLRSPAVLALGKVKIGASMTQSVALVNSGRSNVTIKQATVTGRGFRMSGLTFPLTLSPGQRKPFSVTFTAQAAGSSSEVLQLPVTVLIRL